MTKCILSLFSVLLLGSATLAQTQLPNSNFEDWTTAGNGKDSLIGWSSSNAVAIGMVIPMKKDLDAVQGNFAAKLITAPFGFVGYTKVSILVNGEATFNWMGGSDGYHVEYVSGGGTPISVKPAELLGYYKSNGSGKVDVLVSKYNTTLQKRDTVSFVSQTLPGTPSYIPFTVTLPDLMPSVIPDTITTIFYSLLPDPTPSNGIFSDFYLDSLVLMEAAEPAPVANFTANPLEGTIDSIIQFTDNSTGAPDTWEWTITPGDFIFLSGTDAASQHPSLQFIAPGTYSVKLVVSNSTGSDSLIRANYIQIADTSVGISEPNPTDGWSIHPNPAREKINLPNSFKGGYLQITDSRGRVVLKESNIGGSVNISHLPSGLYFIKMVKNELIRTQKLLIKP